MNIPEPKKLLFVCMGNVGRSQFAEVLFNEYAVSEYIASSAGISLSGPEQRLMELPRIEHMREAVEEIGTDFSSLYRKQLTPEMFAAADRVIFVLGTDDLLPDYALQDLTSKVTRWNVSDPKGTDLVRHREIRDQIKDLIVKNF